MLAVGDNELGMGGNVLLGGGCWMGREHVSDRWKQEKLLGGLGRSGTLLG